ncbi:Eisosomes component [Diaporthe eres]|uniref:Eisosomes component n=1 Tax=Diaporthe eres TaxID=83184 RepID=A0ABR1PRD4_DIAER
MKLTPIRVRGKRGQPKPEKKRKDKGLGDADLEGTPVPNSKRVRKHHGKDGDAKMKNGLSRLSQLPQEVLERVFIASQNLSLPLVSRDLFHRLSSDSIKYQMVGAAFGSTWDAYYGIDKFEVSSYDGWQWDVKRCQGNPDFQSAILACSWAKTPVLLLSFDVWIRQHAAGRAYFTIPQLKKERLADVPRPGSLYDRAYITAADGDESASTMTMREKLGFDSDCFLRYIMPPSTDSNAFPDRQPLRILGDRLRALLGTHLEVHLGTKVPTSLLSGPFESDEGSIEMGIEKMQRLFWLVRGGACIQEDQTWEATRTGFQHILQLVANAGAQDPSGDYDEPPSGQGEAESSSPPPPPAPTTPLERLKLAAGLLALFDFLGIFDAQWPRYIVQTSLLQVSRMIPASAPRSAQEALLGALASKLRSVLGRHGERIVDARHMGMGWASRLERPRAYVREAGFADVCRQRAKMFLYPLTEGTAEGDNLPSSPVVGAAAGGLGHEPWSDFGLD